ncbi:hypothetical protein BpHYR1_045575 [Brachionus plicatilis]|uniref:Uncharacterized protein n=1 Tax=Brachionus plicatilis TaxID=10195 RepID=A0A3M7QMB8_BRAPC|nr:hypothetical protein BpHYR1_045575 [Brachionus plicatilis]
MDNAKLQKLPEYLQFCVNLLNFTKLSLPYFKKNYYERSNEMTKEYSQPKLTAPPTLPPVKKQCPHCLSALVCTVLVRMSYCHCSSDQDHRHNTTA